MVTRSSVAKIPVSEMVAAWQLDKRNRISKFSIYRLSEFTQEVSARYVSSLGAGTKSWGGRDFRTRPSGLFAYIASEYGFDSRETAYGVLEEFCRVKGQKWAKLTLLAMDGALI